MPDINGFMAGTNGTTPAGAGKPDPSSLPPETIAFANRMFDAAREGNSELLLQAVDAGLPINLTNSAGNTLLMLASYSGHAQLVSSLLARGADPNALNDRGQSILSGAVFKGYAEVVRALCAPNNGPNNTTTHPDPKLGLPNAIQTALMFNRKDLLDIVGGVTEEDIKEAQAVMPESVLPAGPPPS